MSELLNEHKNYLSKKNMILLRQLFLNCDVVLSLSLQTWDRFWNERENLAVKINVTQSEWWWMNDQYLPIQCEHSEFATETLQFKTVCAFSVPRRTTSEILTATWAEVVETLLP